MQYAVVESGGKQYKVAPGAIIEIEHLGEKTDSFVFDKVLLYSVDGSMTIGAPYVANVSVSAKILENIRGPKIRIARFLAKSRHRRARGFRQSLSRVQIDEIHESKKSAQKVDAHESSQEKSLKRTTKKASAPIKKKA